MGTEKRKLIILECPYGPGGHRGEPELTQILLRMELSVDEESKQRLTQINLKE